MKSAKLAINVPNRTGRTEKIKDLLFVNLHTIIKLYLMFLNDFASLMTEITNNNNIPNNKVKMYL